MSQSGERKIISTPNAPKAIGPYAQAVKHGNLLFVSGMIAIDPRTNEQVKGDFEKEVALVLDNLRGVVEAAGMGLVNVLKATVFLRDMNDFAKFNEVYARYFAGILPARETVQVARLPRDASIEISVICGE